MRDGNSWKSSRLGMESFRLRFRPRIVQPHHPQTRHHADEEQQADERDAEWLKEVVAELVDSRVDLADQGYLRICIFERAETERRHQQRQAEPRPANDLVAVVARRRIGVGTRWR